MYELHQNEQYFFDTKTTNKVADLLEPSDRSCVLCAPMVGMELEDRGCDVTTLDIDERFADLRSFRRWDLYRPERLDATVDVIFRDPPFFNVSLSQLFNAIRVLAHYDVRQHVAIGYLKRRSTAVESVFSPFGLRRISFALGYRTVQKCERNDIAVFANFEWTTK